MNMEKRIVKQNNSETMKISYDSFNNIDINFISSKGGKFSDDVLSYEDGNRQIYACGVFLNSEECIEKKSCYDFRELLLKLLCDKVPLSKVLHGSYLLIVYDKLKKRLVVYNDLLSKRSVFYRYDEASKRLFISDSFLEIVKMSKEKGLPCTIDELGVKMMLWHGIFYDDVTYVREIKFLRPFDYLEVYSGDFEVKRIEREPMLDVTLDEAASECHQRFSNAVRLQYRKNEVNGFPQITTLSGGMDSRSTFLYGWANGYAKQTGFCYAESSSADYEIARTLAAKYGCSFYYHPIDNGAHLLERDEMCQANEGQMGYAGPTGTYDSLCFYDTDHWGIVHTGLGGGEIMGDMRVPDNPGRMERLVESLKYNMGKGKKNCTWESFVKSLQCTEDDLKRIESFKSDYVDFNEFQSLNDMRRCLNSQKMAQSFGVEYMSPYLYEDFFCYMLRIPYSLTKGRKLYIYWQQKYNPRQFDTPSTFQLGCRPGNKLGYYARRLYKYVINRMGRKMKYDMNPYEFWVTQNPLITKKQSELFAADLVHIKKYSSTEWYRMINEAWKPNNDSCTNVLTASWALSKILNS